MKAILALLITTISISAQAAGSTGCGGACITAASTSHSGNFNLPIQSNNNAVLINQANKNLPVPALSTPNQQILNNGSPSQSEFMNSSNIEDNTHLSTQ